MVRTSTIAASVSIVALVLACGGSGDSSFGPGGDDLNGSSNGGGFGSSGGDGTGGDGTGGNGSSGGDACAAQVANAERVPAYIYFLYDMSGSMGDGTHGDPKKKWIPVTAAFTGFLGSEKSAGVTASMTLFPDMQTSHCSVDSYKDPDVALTPLPNAAAFTAVMPVTNPDETVTGLGTVDEGTPTLPALKGVLPAADENAKQHPDAKTVVVIITDGEPNKCSGNTISNIEDEVEKYKDRVPTYVIGVGDNLDNLNAIAEKGGTGQAIHIDVGDPSVTEMQLADTIETIRRNALTCELAIPAAPPGQTLDFDKINVSYTPSEGAKQELGYDAACAAAGWKFDNPAQPSKIVLCASTCDTAKNDPTGVVGVEFGCERRGGGVR